MLPRTARACRCRVAGPGAAEPVACTRANSLTAQLGLMPNRRAASRRHEPPATATTTRDRRSNE
jgi:hypothetical protein